jgi:protein required for attachment to host cells
MVSMRQYPVTWIVIADGKQAFIYTPQRVEKQIPLARNGKHQYYTDRTSWVLLPVLDRPLRAESSSEYEMGRDQPGRVFESATTARHMCEPRMDVRQEVKIHLMKILAAELNKAHSKKSFDQLVLVAPSRMLGELKKQLKAAVQACVVATLPKDLTHRRNNELVKKIQELI